MAYVPKHKQPGYVPTVFAAPTTMDAESVSKVFETRGWIANSGNLYFNGNGTADHPHLHLMLDRSIKIALNGDVRKCVTMLAWSDGKQGQGGGGRNLVNKGVVYSNAQKTIGFCNMNAKMANECKFLLDGL